MNYLKNVYKKSYRDQDKIITPEETVLHAKQQLKKLDLDILQETRRIDNNRLGIPVFFSIYGADAQKLTGKRKQMGKGADSAQAEASAIMELVERFSLYDFMHQDSSFKKVPLQNMKDPTIPFAQIAQSVHDRVDESSVEYQFFSDLPLRWTRAFDLKNNDWTCIPFDWFFQINAYNGSSAGNCMEEAIIQGMSEVIERHACDLIIRQQKPTRKINLETVSDPVACSLIQRFLQAGVELHVYDYSLDTGIPVLGGIAWDPSTFPSSSEIVWTAGAMPDPARSLSRVLTEIAQLGGDFNTGSSYEPSGLPKLTSVQDIEKIHGNCPIIPFSELPDLSDDNIKTEIMNYQSALSKILPNIYVVDVTHSGLCLPSCYTIMPGACFRERAVNASVGLFTAKLMTSIFAPDIALKKLSDFDHALPGQYYIPFFQGTILLQQSENKKALDYFSTALSNSPDGEDLCDIYVHIGMCEKNMANYFQAISALNQADVIDPCRTDVLNLLGVCYYQINQYASAIDCFERLIQIDPGSAMDYANLGINYKALEKNNKAREYLEKAVTLDPGITFAWEHLMELSV